MCGDTKCGQGPVVVAFPGLFMPRRRQQPWSEALGFFPVVHPSHSPELNSGTNGRLDSTMNLLGFGGQRSRSSRAHLCERDTSGRIPVYKVEQWVVLPFPTCSPYVCFPTILDEFKPAFGSRALYLI